MQSVDKNDVDISKLFVWKKKYEVLDTAGNEKIPVWFRIVGDADLNKARVFAIRKSADLRKALKDPDSDARAMYIPDYSGIDKEELIKIILMASTNMLSRLAIQQVQTPYPVEPSSSADLEEMERFQKEVDEWAKKRNDALRNFILEEFEKLEAQLREKSEEDLIKEYERLIIADICENEMIKRFREMCTFYSCYTDENLTNKLFKTFEEFDNLPEFYKKQFIELYQELELGTDELKK